MLTCTILSYASRQRCFVEHEARIVGECVATRSGRVTVGVVRAERVPVIVI